MSARRALTAAAVVGLVVTVCGVRSAHRTVVDSVLVPLPHPSDGPAYRGALHVHTVRSDGRGDDAAVARAAKRANLDFVIVTDHNVPPLPPAYIDGVLLARGVELSTTVGHLLALGVTGAPFVVEREADPFRWTHANAGVAVIAHPLTPARPWTEWARVQEAAAIEILSGDSLFHEALRPPWSSLMAALLSFPFNRQTALFSLYDRPASVLQLWDKLAAQGRMLGLCSADAHGIPPYKDVFEQFVLHVAQPTSPRSGDAAADAATLVNLIAAGETFCAVEALGDAHGFRFEARSGDRFVPMGGAVDAPAALAVRLFYEDVPSDVTIVLLRDGVEMHRSKTATLDFIATQPGAYRIEIRRTAHRLYFGDRETTWIYSNPLWVR